MMTFINHYSFILTFAITGLGLAFFLLRDGLERNDVLALVALVIGFVFAFTTFNAGASDITRTEQFDRLLESGSPILLEIQSPYCLACATAKPIVDRIEANHPDLSVIHVNIQDRVGATLAQRFETRVTPTFLLFDDKGAIILRTFGAIDPQAVASELEE